MVDYLLTIVSSNGAKFVAGVPGIMDIGTVLGKPTTLPMETTVSPDRNNSICQEKKRNLTETFSYKS